MKKTLAIILTLALMLCMIPGTAFAETPTPRTTVMVQLSAEKATYNGQDQKPTVTSVTQDGNPVTSGYTVVWTKKDSSSTTLYEIKDAGTYTATVTIGSGDSALTGDAEFTINPLDLSTLTNSQINVTPKVSLYDDTTPPPTVTVTVDGKALPSDDFELAEIKDANAGTKNITIKAPDGATNTTNEKAISNAYTIDPIDLSKATMSYTGTLSSTDLNKNENDLKVQLLAGTKVMQNLSGGGSAQVKNNYLEVRSIEYYNGSAWTTNKPTTTVTKIRYGVSTNNNVSGSNVVAGITLTCAVDVTKSLNSNDFVLTTANGNTTFPNETYTGSPITPAVRVYSKKADGKIGTLLDSRYYSVSYGQNNTIATQTVTITATGINGYTGSVTNTFYIQPRDINGAGISISNIGSGTQNNSTAPSFTVKYNNKELVKGTDYTVTNVNTSVVGNGTGKLTIRGNGNFDGSREISFNVAAKNLDDATVSPTYFSQSVDYSGSNQTPSFTVYHGTDYVSPSYYKIRYDYTDANNVKKSAYEAKDARTYTVYIEGTTTTYGGSKYIGTFTIKKIDTANVNVTASQASTTSALNVTVRSKYTNATFTQGKDYTVSTPWFSGGKGHITITPTADGNLTGASISHTYTVAGKSIASCTVTLDKTSFNYTGSTITPTVTVRDGYTLLTKGTDYTVTYKDAAGKVVTSPRDAGTYTVEISGTNGYSGTVTRTFTIVGTDISNYMVTLKEASVNADGYSKTPQIVSVKYGYTTLSSVNYTVSYENAAGTKVYSMSTPGTYKVVVTGKNGYSGSTYATFRIVGTPQTINITKTAYKVYVDSESFKINATATGDGTGFSYTSNNPSVATVSATGVVTVHKLGRAVITVTTTGMKKSEPASDEVYVKVHPKKTTLTRKPWTNGKKGSFKVRWAKQDDVTKYQIRYSRDKDFSTGSYLTKTVNDANVKGTQSTTVSGLKRGAKYYVKVRAIKEVYNENGTKITYYGTWSNWRSVRTN